MKTHNNNNILTVILIIVLAIWSFSCTPTRSIVLDIPQPARKELPPAVQSLTLVSQAINDSFTDLHTDSLQKIFYEKRFNLDTVIYDFQMADTTLKALGELLFESGRYDYVIPENRFLDPPLKPATELSWEVASSLTETFETDAVLSLDHLRTRVITSYKNETQYNAFQGGFNTAVVANMRIQYEALFRIYFPQEKRILLREFVRDTLMWEDADVTAGALFSRFTPVKTALTEAGIAIALDLSDKIGVRWRPERRSYFISGNAGLRQGDQTAMQGNWEKAVAIWKNTAENTRSKSIQSKSLLNVALGYEITGDIDSAISWALKSYETMYRPLTYEYLEILRRRKNEIRKE